MIEITVDGKKVEVREGSMVMDAANRLGVYVPHFCYHKKLSIAANCRMCLVDVEKAPKPLPACATPVTAGMVVHTRSDKAIKAQKGVMEFLLINHPLDCPICDQGGECQLQDLAVGYGSSASRYTEEKRVVFHKDVGPLVAMEEMSRCIHCTRCVRFGQEIAGVMELGMVNRGEFSEITTFVGRTVDSELSGNMIDICPVGALTSKPFRYSARTWELSRRRSVSPHDALGANLIVQVKNDRVMRVLPFENEEINECWLSDKDRFSYEGLNAADRVTRPLRKIDGAWHEVEWSDALAYAASALAAVRAEHGAAALGALVSPHSTFEEAYLAQKLMRGLGSENVDSRLRQTDFALDGALAGVPWLGMPIPAVSQLDRALVIGSFLRKDQPLVAQRLRQAAKRGARVSALHAVDDDWLMPMAGRLVVAPSRWPAALAGLARAVAAKKGLEAPEFAGSAPSAQAGAASELTAATEATEATEAIAASLLSGSRKAILLGAAALQHPRAAALHALAQWIATATGAALGVLPEAANSVGSALAGAVPGAAGLHTRAQLEQPLKGYLLLNIEPELDLPYGAAARAAFGAADVVVALSAYKHGVLDYADVILPIAPFTETAGTFVNMEARVQSFNGAVKPLGETRPAWKVLRVLGNLCQLAGFDYESIEGVRAEALGTMVDFSARCGNAITADLARFVAHGTPDAGGLERIADVPIYFADPIVRRAPSLQLTRDARVPSLRVNGRTAARLGIGDGDAVLVRQDGGSAELLCEIDSRVGDGVARIAAAHPTTAALGGLHGPIEVAPSAAAVPA